MGVRIAIFACFLLHGDCVEIPPISQFQLLSEDDEVIIPLTLQNSSVINGSWLNCSHLAASILLSRPAWGGGGPRQARPRGGKALDVLT